MAIQWKVACQTKPGRGRGGGGAKRCETGQEKNNPNAMNSHVGRGLIEYQHSRLVDHRPGDTEQLSLPRAPVAAAFTDARDQPQRQVGHRVLEANHLHDLPDSGIGALNEWGCGRVGWEGQRKTCIKIFCFGAFLLLGGGRGAFSPTSICRNFLDKRNTYYQYNSTPPYPPV